MNELTIDECIESRQYRKLFEFSVKDIQIYFDDQCMKGNQYKKIHILLHLFNDIDITNGLIYSYIHMLDDLFRLLVDYITDSYRASHPDIIETMIIHSFEYHKDHSKYINRELLRIIIDKYSNDIDKIFLSAIESNIIELTKMLITRVKDENVIKAFGIAYKSGNYKVAKYTYDTICARRIMISSDLGYCPSGSIISMIRYQEFYRWEEQFSASVRDFNFYALESLVKKMPYRCNLPFSMLEPAVYCCPDSLLTLIMGRFTVIGLDSSYVATICRIPITEYYDNQVLKGDWRVIHDNESKYY